MSTFKIYQHATQGYQAVKVGFSWPAFFFGWMWMLAKQMWTFAGIFGGAQVMLLLIGAVTGEAQSQPELQGLMYLLVAGGRVALVLAAGFKGNGWRCANLEQRGFLARETVEAGTPDAAVAQVAGAAARVPMLNRSEPVAAQ